MQKLCRRKGCREKAVSSRHSLCKKHFIFYFESRVKQTISRFGMLGTKDKVLVACSGGKDSLSALYLLRRFHKGVVDAIIIDEGAEGYRSVMIPDVAGFCKEHGIRLIKTSFSRELGYTLDEVMRKSTNPCTVCGTLRRKILNRHAKCYDKIATGHNLDDQAQALLMNFFKSQKVLLARQGIKSRGQRLFTQKIKPLALCHEDDVWLYSRLMRFKIADVSCPYSSTALRSSIREFLDKLEREIPGAKLNIVENWLGILPSLEDERPEKSVCRLCGQPCKAELCKACKILEGMPPRKA